MEKIEHLKRNLERDYGFKIKKWKVIKDEKNSSFVVQIVTGNGEKYALKSLYMAQDRQFFIAKSEQLLAAKGVNLARPIPTRKNNLHIIYKKHPYVLYQWIDGKSAQLDNQAELESIIEAMALFHNASSEISYSSDTKIYEHRQWKKEYKERIKSIESWFNAHKTSNKKNDAMIKRFIPFFKQMAKVSLKKLKSSKYDDYIEGKLSKKSLVHGDLHHNNVINSKAGKTLIDFEDVRYDLPSKDLLRTYSMYTKNHSFHKKSFDSMLKKYEEHHPLSNEVKQLVMIDLLFPHIFERLLRKKKYVGMSSKELKHRLKQEKKKAAYIYNQYFSKIGTQKEEAGK